MDRNLSATIRFFEDTEEAMANLCYTEAARNAKSMQEADACEDGSVGCSNCPFKPKEVPK